jgi:heme A synthase
MISTIFDFSDGFHQIRSIHTIISMTFMVIAVWLLIRSVQGIWKGYAYTGLDKFLAYGFIVNLYLQLIFGLILFVNPASVANRDYSGAQSALEMASKRFWPIEHIVLMLFALFIANLGLIFSNKSTDSREKHRKIIIYYAIALIMIAISLGAVKYPLSM